MKQFNDFIAEVRTYDQSGSGKEKKFYNDFYRGGDEVFDHDGDPVNWTEAGQPKSNTATNRNATPGDQATPTVDAKVVIADELPMKKYAGKGSKAVSEAQSDVRDVYRDEIDELISDISDLKETLVSVDGDMYSARAIANRLRETRDYILGALGSNEQPVSDNSPTTASESYMDKWNTSEDRRNVLASLQEGLDSGTIKLHDGSKVMVEAFDAALLQVMFEELSESVATKLMNTMVSSKTDFFNIVEYAKSTLSEESKEKASKKIEKAFNGDVINTHNCDSGDKVSSSYKRAPGAKGNK